VRRFRDKRFYSSTRSHENTSVLLLLLYGEVEHTGYYDKMVEPDASLIKHAKSTVPPFVASPEQGITVAAMVFINGINTLPLSRSCRNFPRLALKKDEECSERNYGR
jgi:hypothetical protein